MKGRFMRKGILLVTSLFVAAAAASAQGAGRAQSAEPKAPGAQRLQLEQRLRERTGEIVKRRLALTDDQMTKLQSTNLQFEQQRVDLLRRERQTRQALRAQLLSGDSANQARVGQLLDQSLMLQRQRIDLVQNEQRELARFLTPVQRAKYFGLQNEMRKRAQALQNGQMQGGGMNGMRRPLARRLKQ